MLIIRAATAKISFKWHSSVYHFWHAMSFNVALSNRVYSESLLTTVDVTAIAFPMVAVYVCSTMIICLSLCRYPFFWWLIPIQKTVFLSHFHAIMVSLDVFSLKTMKSLERLDIELKWNFHFYHIFSTLKNNIRVEGFNLKQSQIIYHAIFFVIAWLIFSLCSRFSYPNGEKFVTLALNFFQPFTRSWPLTVDAIAFATHNSLYQRRQSRTIS